MRGGVVALIRTPIPAAHLFELGPAIERSERDVIHNQSLAGAYEFFDGFVGALSPTVFVSAVVVIDNNQIVVCQRLGSGAAEFLVHADFELPRIFEDLLQYRRGSAPVMH